MNGGLLLLSHHTGSLFREDLLLKQAAMEKHGLDTPPITHDIVAGARPPDSLVAVDSSGGLQEASHAGVKAWTLGNLNISTWRRTGFSTSKVGGSSDFTKWFEDVLTRPAELMVAAGHHTGTPRRDHLLGYGLHSQWLGSFSAGRIGDKGFGGYLPRVWWTNSALLKIEQGASVPVLYGDTVREMRADDLFAWLCDMGPSFGWTRVFEASALQNAANAGGVGLICADRRAEGRAGHITVVVPEVEGHSAVRDADGHVVQPLQTQAGARNFRYGSAGPSWWMSDDFIDRGFFVHQ